MAPQVMTPQELLEKYRKSCISKGYHLHASLEHCMETVKSILENIKRYGYPVCPCRLPTNAERDRDIMCPCSYRDEDIKASGACYCILFVSDEHKDDSDFFPEVADLRKDVEEDI